MISYADVVTLLLPVFVVLFMSDRAAQEDRADAAFIEAASRITKASPVSVPESPTLTADEHPARELDSESTPQPDGAAALASPADGAESVAPAVAVEQDIEALVQSAGLSRRIHTRQERRGLVVSLIEAGFFETGSATPRPDALPVLDALAQILASKPLHLRVEGHTDNAPIRTPQFPSNWELSTARATWLVAYFADTLGLAPERLSAAGYGEFRPVASNETREGRAKNRRVDLVVLAEPSVASEPSSLPPAEP